MARSERDVTRDRSRAQFAATLRRIADAVEDERSFLIQVHGERLRVPATATFSIEHERTGSGNELELQLTWQGTAR